MTSPAWTGWGSITSTARPWSRARSPPRTAAGTWEARRCCAPPAGGGDRPALGPALIVGGRWRRGRPDGQIVEIERELGDVDDGGLLRSTGSEPVSPWE